MILWRFFQVSSRASMVNHVYGLGPTSKLLICLSRWASWLKSDSAPLSDALKKSWASRRACSTLTTSLDLFQHMKKLSTDSTDIEATLASKININVNHVDRQLQRSVPLEYDRERYEHSWMMLELSAEIKQQQKCKQFKPWFLLLNCSELDPSDLPLHSQTTNWKPKLS